jgi:hypothetical protein
MPATVPSHQAAVLPLKLRYPRAFDGVALVVGSAAPDVVYTVDSLGVTVGGHAWHAQFWCSLPLTLVLGWLIRRAAPFVAAHLPDGRPFALRDYGVLATVRHPLRVTVLSALLGAFSHIAWDSFTHPYTAVLGGLSQIPALHRTAFAGQPWWRVLHLVSELVGTAVVLAAAWRIGRGRLLLAWHGPAPDVARRPALFWSVAAVAGAAAFAVAYVVPGMGDGLQVIGTRVLAAGALALLAGAAATALADGTPDRGRIGVPGTARRPGGRE